MYKGRVSSLFYFDFTGIDWVENGGGILFGQKQKAGPDQKIGPACIQEY